MKKGILGTVAAATLLAGPGAAPAADQQAFPAASVQAASIPAASAVVAVYDRFNMTPMWFQNGVASPAAGRLVSILQRAPFDGLASGPQLAAQVQGALAQAATGDKAAVAAAERTLSAAWVTYVQHIRRPTPGMAYAYPVLEPQNRRPDQILLTAAAAPSLLAHLETASNVNYLYAQLRDAAVREAQAKGQTAPDPRLLLNLERARTLPATGRFVLVDAASQRLWMFENGQPVDSMKVIVGMSDMPTPMIASYMYYATFNPYWNVPHHLVRKTIAANVLKQGMGYLKTRGYEVMTDWTENAAPIPPDQIDWKAVQAGKQEIRVRQKPGAANSMGVIKFPFPNDEDIYLHDTPSKGLFAKSARTLSNGCVRLEDAKRLGRWLLGREPVAPSDDPEIRVQLPRGVPIYLTYLTAQPQSDGINYLSDPYGWDRSPGQQVAAR